MILYFADRRMNILGKASSHLRKGVKILSDNKTEDVESGVASFEATFSYTRENRKEVESWAKSGNYILRKSGSENEFYTIIESESDTENQEVIVYAEDAGLDLLNEVVGPYEADKAYPIDHYINKFSYDSGFVIGVNEIKDLSRKLKWEGEATATERLASVATQFDNAEISYSFEIKRLKVTKKIINIHRKRGVDTDIQLRKGKEIENIVVKQSIAELATSLLVTGGTPENSEVPITLKGYKYDDGDFHVSGDRLNSRKALEKWSRYVWKDEPNQVLGCGGHIIKNYSYDTLSQSELCKRAITKLKSICDVEVNYEADIIELPDNVRVGDRINIIDDDVGLYLNTRILKLETSESDETKVATLGENLLKESGISKKVEDLAEQFKELADSRVFYTWIVYADDEKGNGISLLPDGKRYMGIAENKLTENPDISDPTIFKWSLIKGADGGGYTVILENDNFTFKGDTDSVEGTQTIKCKVQAMYGDTVVACTLGEIKPPNGMTIVSDNASPFPTLTVTVTDALTKGGSVTIPVIIRKTTVLKAFNYSISFKGLNGQSVDKITLEYYVSTSKTELVDGSWSDIYPTWVRGTYLWLRQKTVYKNPPKTEYSEPYVDPSWETATDVEENLEQNYYDRTEIDKELTFYGDRIESTVDRVGIIEDDITGNEQRVTIAESTIKQLADMIAHLIVDEKGSSMMTQTPDGWRYDMSKIMNAVNNAAGELNKLAGSVEEVDKAIKNTNSLVNDVAKKTAYITMTMDETGAPCIELGKEDNDFKLRITNTSVDFIEGSSKVAYINNKTLYIERAIIKGSLQIGEIDGFIFEKTGTGNLAIF